MKAIEILYLKLNELNNRLQAAEDLDDKYICIEKIVCIVNAIKDLAKYRIDNPQTNQDAYL